MSAPQTVGSMLEASRLGANSSEGSVTRAMMLARGWGLSLSTWASVEEQTRGWLSLSECPRKREAAGSCLLSVASLPPTLLVGAVTDKAPPPSGRSVGHIVIRA